MSKNLSLRLAISLLLLLLAPAAWWVLGDDGPGEGEGTPANGSATRPASEEARLASLIENEDLLLDLTPRLIALALWYQRGPEEADAALPAGLQSLQRRRGLAVHTPTFKAAGGDSPEYVKRLDWPLETREAQGRGDPWRPLMQLDVAWETLRFGVVRAGLQSPDRFHMQTKAEARGHHPDGSVYGFKARQDLTFTQVDGSWRLTDWIQKDVHVYRAPQALFRDVTASALPSPDTLEDARRSDQLKITLGYARTGIPPVPDPKYAAWVSAGSAHFFPAVTVVDFDGDGNDDLFLTSRWGPTQMLRNNGNGTFTDVAYDVGLRVVGMVNCALFADLDNDGDKDAILGRAMEPALYLRNDGGHFRDVTAELTNLGALFFTTAISATDVNRDGLLDLYLSTYPPLDQPRLDWAQVFLSQEEQALVATKRLANHRWLNSVGCSNVLLMNRGGGVLERVPYDDLLSQWRRSFQTAWADLDADGDDDLYICNDFAPDALLRNDTPRGAAQPVFTDITKEKLKGVAHGFGMGVSWGDFDADGDLDLYVSNMYSKAGKRIIAHMQTVDPRIRAAAAGNFLFENNAGVLQQRSGSGPDEFHVHQVGWSWGGQWADFNNDGRLDLYVPSGYYTAPKELDTQVDN